MEHGTETAARTWTTPECPFQIEYLPRVLDDIRLAVVDAFFSLPRGGAEIGGVLLGRHEAGVIAINGFEPLDCEHAMGPSFNLSARDQSLLAEMTAKAKRNPDNLQPVGWYHSHTRSEIFLSDADLEIHKRYFPEPWQIALVLKPHTFQPTRCGFFFREADGRIHATAAYKEFVLEALPFKPAPANAPGGPQRVSNGTPAPKPAPAPVLEMPARPKEKGPVPITREIAVDPPAAQAPESPVTEPEIADAPGFATIEDDRSSPFLKLAISVAVLFLLVIGAYQTRQYWAGNVMNKLRPMLPKDTEGTLSLSVKDEDGQLNIQWDRNAPILQTATDGTIEITDGKPPRIIHLDAQHLTIGSFRYARESERVDVALTVVASSGIPLREQAVFVGSLPTAKDDTRVRSERDAFAEKADKLQKDLNWQASKTRKLEKDIQELLDQKKKQAEGDAGKK